VREALFSLLGDMDGLVVLDLFAGSGALAVEAISRGARRAVLVERSPAALAALRGNLTALGLDRGEAEIRRAHALTALRGARSAGETYDLVFLDPPYRSAPALGGDLSQLLPPVITDGARVICESDRRAPLELDLPRADQRRYGDTVITIHTPPPRP